MTPGWRLTWARRENARRRRAFDSGNAAWRRDHDHLLRLRIEAGGFHGYAQPRDTLPVDLGHDEVVYRVLPAVELVEAGARHIAGLPTPELTVTPPELRPSDRGLPTGLRVVDTGMAVVTSRRVAFSGRTGRREWTYEDLVGPAHHPDVSVTLLHTADGSPLAGLRVPATATVNFRFYLTLAVAAATGRRAAIAAQVDALLAGHQGRRPTPPAPADPDQAPLTALRHDRATIAAAVVAVAFATLTAGASSTAQTGPAYRASLGGASGTATTDAPPGVDDTAPSTPTTPAAPGSGPATPAPGPATPAPTGGGTPPADDQPPRRPRTIVAAAASAEPPPGRAGRSGPATAPAPATTPPPTTAPSPTTVPSPTAAVPTPEAPILTLCLEPLRLPLAQRLLCPPTSR